MALLLPTDTSEFRFRLLFGLRGASENSSPFLNRLQDSDVLDSRRINLHWVGRQDHQIGELPDRDRALAIFLEILVRGVDGKRFQPVKHRDAFVRSDRLPGARSRLTEVHRMNMVSSLVPRKSLWFVMRRPSARAVFIGLEK